MLISYDLCALAAAACWACSSITSVSPARHLGAFAFNRWRMGIVAVMLWAATFFMGAESTLSYYALKVMALSSFIGIFIGDTALFAAVNRLGPRRTGVLFATHAMLTAIAGAYFFNEQMRLKVMLGAILTIAGVMVAIMLGKRKEESHVWEINHGHIGIGIALGLLSAVCQALSTLIVKPIMQTHVDPIAASAVRVSVAWGLHYLLVLFKQPMARSHQTLTRHIFIQIVFNGFIGMGLGTSFLLLALKHGQVGIVAILSAVSPVLVLPLLWWKLGRAPAGGAWLGGILTVIGTALILTR